MKISCWTLFIMLSFCGAKIVFFTVKQTKFQLVFEEVPHSGQWRASFFPLFAVLHGTAGTVSPAFVFAVENSPNVAGDVEYRKSHDDRYGNPLHFRLQVTGYRLQCCPICY